MLTTLIDCGLGKERLFQLMLDSGFTEIINMQVMPNRSYEYRSKLREQIFWLSITNEKNVAAFLDDEKADIRANGNYTILAYHSHIIIKLYEQHFVIVKDREFCQNLGTPMEYPQ